MSTCHLFKSPVKRLFRTPYSVASSLYKHSNRSFAVFDIQAAFAEDEKLLLTPGPLSTSSTVKACLTRDFGSRDPKFIELIASVRKGILDVANVDSNEFTSILLQGSGTFAVESAIGACVPKENNKILIITNGAYADRAGIIAKYYDMDVHYLRYVEDTLPIISEVDEILSENCLKNGIKPFSAVFMVHSETTSGLVNPIREVGEIAAKHNVVYIVDAMSSFGGIPIDFYACNIDFLVTSCNKCLQGVPGFGIVIARNSVLEECEGNARSLSLDIYEQAKGLNSNGQFRFTPPTHIICAFQQALNELIEEGGVGQRNMRYKRNQEIVHSGMIELGFELYLKPSDCGCIISSFRYPQTSNWDFNTFYNKLAMNNYLIYPGKVTDADCFRIGHIGNIMPADSEKLMDHIKNISHEMNLFGNTEKSAI